MRVGTILLFLVLEEMLSAFTVDNEVSCGLVIFDFVMLRYIPSIPTLLRIVITIGY